MRFHIFHDWSKWEQYECDKVYEMHGILVPRHLLGKSWTEHESRQKRYCLKCGFLEDEKIESNE